MPRPPPPDPPRARRWQSSLAFRIIFATAGIGMPALMAAPEGLSLRTKPGLPRTHQTLGQRHRHPLRRRLRLLRPRPVFVSRAVYLTVDAAADRDVQEDFRRRGLISGVLLAPLAAVVFFAARHGGATHMYEGLTLWWAPLLLA